MRQTRFTPDQDATAFVSRDLEDNEFAKGFSALPINESFNGVSLVVLQMYGLKTGERVLVKVGNLAPLVGEIKWVKNLDAETQRVGVYYD